MEDELPYIIVAVAIVLLASVAAWIELRSEPRERDAHRHVLRNDPRYREHVARRRGRRGPQ